MKPRGLSKSKLLSFLQCPKRLWLEVRRPELAEEGPSTEHLFSVGHRVGEVARSLIPDGVLIESAGDLQRALADTRTCLSAGAATIFEATFEHDGVLVRADILHQEKGRLTVKEVKASTSVKDYHLSDAAVQAWVIRKAGLELDSISIQHIDNTFVYPGGGHYLGLFTEQSVDADIRPLVTQVPAWISDARKTLAGNEPSRDMGSHCTDPFDCPFQGYCETLAPHAEYPVELLPRGGQTIAKLLAEGYRDLRDVPSGRLTSDNHERVRRVTTAGIAEFNASVMEQMQAFPWPRTFMDFETVMFAVPIWPGTRPYQQLPFQWSCHLQHADGHVEHKQFLDLSGKAPMQAFLASLLDAVGSAGPIFVYYAPFETTRLKELQAIFPESKDAIDNVLARIVDLLPLTRDHYYHPAMMGSWSLKAVLPTIDPALDYSDLGEVANGGSAPLAYLEAIDPETSAERKEELERALFAYCKRDTEALVRIAEFLQTGT